MASFSVEKIVLRVNGRTSSFEVRQSPLTVGSTQLRMWWMPRRMIYGQRRADPSLCYALSNYFWQKCVEEGVEDDVENHQKYVLAQLCPDMRCHASRKIFQDADISRSPGIRRKLIRDTNDLIQQSIGQEMKLEVFYRSIGDILGIPDFDDSDRTIYDKFESELLERACTHLPENRAAAIRIARKQLKSMSARYGRRARMKKEKLALNSIAYDSRVAIHQCYSVVWIALIAKLSRRHELSKMETDLHYFLHLDQLDLFHGQPFGLHPSYEIFIQTEVGSNLLEQCLLDIRDQTRLRRFLNAFYLAAYKYSEEYEMLNKNRRKI